MEQTFGMSSNAKRECLKAAKEMARIGEGDDHASFVALKSLIGKLEASLDTNEITFSEDEQLAVVILAQLKDLLDVSMNLRKATADEDPELSGEQIIEYSAKCLMTAPESAKEEDAYKALLSLHNKCVMHTGGDLELTKDEHKAYISIKAMYYGGIFS